jgi:hypothetical protein
MDGKDYLLKLEKNMMVGSARFVADFAESFLDYPLDNVTFDLMIRGGTRLRQGVFISKAYSYLIGPNHFVSCFAHLGSAEGAKFHTLTRAVSKFNKDEQMTWAWLLIAHDGSFPKSTIRLAQSWSQTEIGIALVDYQTQSVVAHSETYLGRALAKHAKAFK